MDRKLAASPLSRFNPFTWLWRHFYGFEFFISYAQRDGRAYAEALHRELTRNRQYRCFLDKEVLEAGQGLTPAILSALRRCEVLIVLRTPAVARSEWVTREVACFTQTGRRIIVIDLRPDVPPAAESASPLDGALAERLAVREPGGASGPPSAATLTAVRNSFNGVRIETRRFWIVSAIALVLLAATLLALVFGLGQKAAKEEARREAVAARRETSNRLAVQSVEKLRGAPVESLRLAIQAVRTFRAHDDPLVPEALGALQRVYLALSPSRPLIRASQGTGEPTVSPNLRWVAAATPAGGIALGPVGAPSPDLLEPLAPGPVSSAASAPRRHPQVHLAFAANSRLLAAARTVPDPASGNDTAEILAWPLDPEGRAGSVRRFGCFPISSWGEVQLQASPDARWLVWTDGYTQAWLAHAAANPDAPDPTLIQDLRDPILRVAPDSSQLFVASRSQVRRWHLGATGTAEELPPLGDDLDRIVALAVAPREPRVAALTLRGEAAWWDLSPPGPVTHRLTNVFSAFTPQMRVFALEPASTRAELAFGPAGQALLVSVVETAHEDFGLAATIVLPGQPPPAWVPLLHRHSGRYLTRTSRISGELGGAVAGYRLDDADVLGAADGFLIIDGEAAVTRGFDGTVLFRNLARGTSMHVTTRASSLTTLPLGSWLVAGCNDGRVEVWDMRGDEEGKPAHVFNGHDAPVREVRLDPSQSRILSIDASRTGRVWDTRHPSVDTGSVVDTSPDGRWLVTEAPGRTRKWLLWDAVSDLTLRAPVSGPMLTNLARVDFDAGTPWAATLHHPSESGRAVARLWDLSSASSWAAPHGQLELEPAVDLERLIAGRLRMEDDVAWLLVATRSPDGTDINLGTLDLRGPAGPLRPVEGVESARAWVGMSPDHRWLAVETTAPASRSNRWITLRDWTRPSGRESLRTLAVSTNHGYLRLEFAPGNTWVTCHTVFGPAAFYRLDPPAPHGVQAPEETALRVRDIAMSAHQPPLWVDEDGGVHQVRGRPSSPTAPGMSTPILTGRDIRCLAWDPTGRWLALGDADGGILVHPVPAPTTPDALPAQLAGDPGALRLPRPERINTGGIHRVFLAADAAWAGAVTDEDQLLLWHRRLDGAWDVPMVLPESELRADSLGGARFADAAPRVLVGGRILTLDPDTLITAAESLSPWVLESVCP